MKTSIALVFALCLLSPPARAQDVLEIPESCGSTSELAREVAALRASTRSTLQAERPAVRMTREGDGYLLTVELPDGRRSLRDPDCRALFRAAIVIAALGHESSVENVLGASDATSSEAESVEAAARQRTEAAKLGAQAKPLPAQQAAPVPPIERAVELESRAQERARRAPRSLSVPYVYPRRLSARALLRAELAYGVVPALSGTFAVGVALEYARLAARAMVGYQGPPRIHGSAGESVRVHGLSASLSLELVALPWLRPGLGVDLHALHGRGRGGLSSRADWALQPTLHASLALRMLQRGPIWLELSVRALWAPRPAEFTMTGRDAVYRASQWGLAGGIGAGYQFL